MDKKFALLISFLVLILSTVILIVSASQISVSSIFEDEITIEAILNSFFDVFAFIVIGIIGIVTSIKKIFQQF